ncbi:MAG: hypothetical protein IJ056_05580 [Acidaminococcaceae bacterium]|nr:hypothetical protein [Acidaminococcaceae bacterium]
MQYYFPSCKFTQMKPETSEKIKNFMATAGVRVVGCCRPGHKALSGWNDTAITVCETCSIIIGENRPAAKVISLYEFIDSLAEFPLPDYKGERITLQDCYRAKEKAAEKAAIRSLLRKMNIKIVELPGTEEEINFDGSFLLGAMRPDNFTLAPRRFAEIKKDMTPKTPEETDAWLKEYCRRFTTERVACYCNSCIAGLQQGLPEGKAAVHVAELLFP